MDSQQGPTAQYREPCWTLRGSLAGREVWENWTLCGSLAGREVWENENVYI